MDEIQMCTPVWLPSFRVIICVFITMIVQPFIPCEGAASFPTTVSVALNHLVELPCIISVSADGNWLHSDQTITQSGNVYPKSQDRYSLETGNATGGDYYNLTLLRSTEDMEGEYSCQDSGQSVLQTTVTVEVPPNVQMNFNNSEVKVNKTIDVILNDEYTIKCLAFGGKPTVSLLWQVNGVDQTVGVSSPVVEERNVSSSLNYRPAVDDISVACITHGQNVIDDIEVLRDVSVLYAPTCQHIITNSSDNEVKLTCSCVAKPAIHTYEIYVNDSLLVSESSTLIPSIYPATVYCVGTNDVGTFKTEVKSIDQFYVEPTEPSSSKGLIVGLVVTFLVILIAVVIFSYCFIKQRRKELLGDPEKVVENATKDEQQKIKAKLIHDEAAETALPDDDIADEEEPGENQPLKVDNHSPEVDDKANKDTYKEVIELKG